MPRVGSSKMKMRHVAREPLAEHDLLLVAAAQQPRPAAWAVALTRSSSTIGAGHRRLAPPRQTRRAGASRRPCGSAMLRATVRPGTSPCALRSSGSSPMPRAIASAGARNRTRGPRRGRGLRRTRSAPAIARASSVRPAPSSPAMPRTSPRVQREADVAAAMPRAEVLRRAAARRRARRAPSGKCSLRSRFAISRTSSGDGHLARSAASSTCAAVAHDGDALADAEHLVEPVRDVDDRRRRARPAARSARRAASTSRLVSAEVGSSIDERSPTSPPCAFAEALAKAG